MADAQVELYTKVMAGEGTKKEGFSTQLTPEMQAFLRDFCDATGYAIDQVVPAGICLVAALPLELRAYAIEGKQALLEQFFDASMQHFRLYMREAIERTEKSETVQQHATAAPVGTALDADRLAEASGVQLPDSPQAGKRTRRKNKRA